MLFSGSGQVPSGRPCLGDRSIYGHDAKVSFHPRHLPKSPSIRHSNHVAHIPKASTYCMGILVFNAQLNRIISLRQYDWLRQYGPTKRRSQTSMMQWRMSAQIHRSTTCRSLPCCSRRHVRRISSLGSDSSLELSSLGGPRCFFSQMPRNTISTHHTTSISSVRVEMLVV
jgi:hypothetical protein